MANGKTIFTIGHSNLEPQEFLGLLSRAKIAVVADVRSVPQSGRFPQFGQAALECLLSHAGVEYVFLGEELGGRPDDPAAYHDDGRVNYAVRRRSFAFRSGIDQLLRLSEQKSVSILCAEEDPLDCHRFLMISPELVAARAAPMHLRKDGSVESQQTAEDRLLAAHGFSGIAANTLFPEARAEALEKAYELQSQRAAFRVDPATLNPW